MDLTQYLRVVRRRWRTILATFLATLAVTALLTAVADRQYRATAQLYVSTVSADNPADLAQGSNYTQRQVATYTDIVTAPLVLDPVLERLGLEMTSQQLADKVVATARPGPC